MTDALIGKYINGYEILDVVGRGGMATVYRAQQLSMNRVVALKLLPEQFAKDDTYIQRFEQEVEIVSRLEHRNIVPVYDYGQYSGRPYIVMRYMNSGSVDELLRSGPLELDQIVHIYEQIAPALDYAHTRKVLHRDLKPGNVLLDDDGGAYLTDFGIARVLGDQVGPGITTQGVVGTPSYMSPEQAQGQQLDNRSDIYALGVMLFELATGKRPFESDTPYSIAVMQVTTQPPSPRSINPDLSMAVEEVILKSLRKKREERYPHAIGLAEALKRAANLPSGSMHDTQPGGIKIPNRPAPQPLGNPQADSPYAPQYEPQPMVIMQPTSPVGSYPPPAPMSYGPPMTPAPMPTQPPPYTGKRRRRKEGNMFMSAAVGGLLGCAVLIVLVILLILGYIAIQGGFNPGTTVESNGDGTSVSSAPTLDATSQSARDTLIPATPSPLPLGGSPVVNPVGVRATLSLELISRTQTRAMVYFAARGGRSDVYRFDFASGEERQLTFDPNEDNYPQVSPDGTRIVFQSNRDGDFDIYVMDINGDNLRQLTQNTINDRLPAWSWDGQRIVYASDTRGDRKHDIYEMNGDGSDQRLLYTNGLFNSHPRYSPNGQYIVFTTGSDETSSNTFEISRLDLDSGEFLQLTTNTWDDRSPSFSADGNAVLYRTSDGGSARGNAAIALMDIDGSNSRILYDGAGLEWGMSFSPDGGLISFTTSSPTTETDEVFFMLPDGTRFEQVTNFGAMASSWVP
ncbi:MAG TPA: protein kinase [Aggregatilineales bacterium]|nr:protein kinase [Aggregatilineales bacterium]